MSTLRTTITELASNFAAGVLNAIRGASLEDILAETNRGGAGAGAGGRRGPGRPKGSGAAAAVSAAAPAESGGGKRRGRRGRLGRRSATDIGQIVERIVTLLSQNPKGLRAEQIRAKLGLEAKELPRPIADALAARKISKQGQKRATTYFAKGAGGAATAAAGGGGGAKRGAAKAGKGKRGAAKAAKAAKKGGKRGGSAKKGAGKGGRKAAPAAAASQSNGTPAETAAS